MLTTTGLFDSRDDLRYYRVVKARLVWATSARVGLAKGLADQVTIARERFFAGGGNSVRGYAEASLTPHDAFGIAVGGNALLELNEELRFPIL